LRKGCLLQGGSRLQKRPGWQVHDQPELGDLSEGPDELQHLQRVPLLLQRDTVGLQDAKGRYQVLCHLHDEYEWPDWIGSLQLRHPGHQRGLRR